MRAKSNIIVLPTPSQPAQGKPIILLNRGDMHEQFTQAEAVLAKNGFYCRAGMLVTIEDGKIKTCKSVNLRVNHLSRLITWVQECETKYGLVRNPSDPPKDVSEALVAAGTWPTIKTLHAVVDHHLLDIDGTLSNEGYNDKNGIFVMGSHISKVPDNPSQEDVAYAVALLSELLVTFDFDLGDEDKAGALCAILTAVARPALPTSPLIVINAPVPGSGKGLLARVIAHFAHDDEPPTCIQSADHDEIHKDLVSRLKNGHPVIFYDEVSMSEIDSPSLRTLATSPVLSSRVLGSNTEITLSTNTLVLMTGNNITPTADTARRILQIRLDPRCEKPSTRQYDYDPIADVTGRRNEVIDAAITIQLAYLQSGQHDAIRKQFAGVGSFENWNKLCRLPIAWATGIDPAHRMLDSLDEDPRRNTLVSVLKAWHEEFGRKPMTSKTVIDAADSNHHGALFDALQPAATDRRGRLATINLGRWLAKHKDRIADGLVLRQAGKLDGNQQWLIDKVKIDSDS